MPADPIHLLRERGDRPYGEEITQVEHALQAAWLAQQAGASDALVVAALLHDVGHLVEPDDGPAPSVDHQHEEISAKVLARWFGPEVTEPVRLHVMAKRYLTRDPSRPLSDASRHSLGLQGGPLDDEEARAFLRLRHAQDSLQLREWDDQAKVVGLKTPPLERWLEVVEGCKR